MTCGTPFLPCISEFQTDPIAAANIPPPRLAALLLPIFSAPSDQGSFRLATIVAVSDLIPFCTGIMSEMKDTNAVVNSEPMDQSGDTSMPSAQQQEQSIKKKFGGLIPKKPPLISKDHERAYFDSADWALGKSGQQGVAKPKGPLEALRPKLQPTRQHQQRSRSSIYTASENEDGDGAGSEDMNIN
ncbi:hypothetical protein ACQ4PT_070166 [Festuca glaucescens]